MATLNADMTLHEMVVFLSAGHEATTFTMVSLDNPRQIAEEGTAIVLVDSKYDFTAFQSIDQTVDEQ